MLPDITSGLSQPAVQGAIFQSSVRQRSHIFVYLQVKPSTPAVPMTGALQAIGAINVANKPSVGQVEEKLVLFHNFTLF